MWTKQTRLWGFTLCVLLAVGTLAFGVTGEEVPSESLCRPYIEKALKGLEAGEIESGSVENNDSEEAGVENETKEESSEDKDSSGEDAPSIEVADEAYIGHETAEALTAEADDEQDNSKEDESDEGTDGRDSNEEAAADDETEEESTEDQDESEDGDSKESDADGSQEGVEDEKDDESDENGEDGSVEDGVEAADVDSAEDSDDKSEQAVDGSTLEEQVDADSKEENNGIDDSKEDNTDDDASTEDNEKSEEAIDKAKSDEEEEGTEDSSNEGDDEKSDDGDEKSGEDVVESAGVEEKSDEDNNSVEDVSVKSEEDEEPKTENKSDNDVADKKDDGEEGESGGDEDSSEGAPEEDLLKVGEIPDNLRSRDHIVKILRLDEEASEAEITIERSADIVLRDLKRLYENAIKPLETLYKYRDLSNRHFGDPEIFSKPLVLFMGPWSGGKSSLINYLTGIEFTDWSLRTGAEPSPAYFNILMYGKEPEVLDGTQLAADWTFSGLQKFGQGLEERLRGLRYPSKLLEKVNVVEIPGILEVRKQVSRVFPFNDACQWFIDRADIIFLVYDPSKLDVGPETEAILDQLKGRESQTRILLNKADTVKPEELMRVQSALIWNISPLMSSAQPPVMYTVSLWSMPYEPTSPVRLLQAQEKELLKDLRTAIDRRIDNKIASARRFAVRVRNHAKMVDCYLTTYYNHKTIFGNKKLIAEAIIENPQNYHIYEGLSTLTNISRYDLPDPETYRSFFRLNPVYDFQQLSATCTYFRGCPINRLDVAIAYDFPELVGKYKKMVENSTPQGMPKS